MKINFGNIPKALLYFVGAFLIMIILLEVIPLVLSVFAEITDMGDVSEWTGYAKLITWIIVAIVGIFGMIIIPWDLLLGESKSEGGQIG